MDNFTIRIEAPELARAITNLATSLSILCVAAEKNEIQVPGINASSDKQADAIPEVPAQTKEASVQQPSIEEVRAAFSEYARAKGKDKAKELLSKYGAAKVTELKAEDYGAAIKEIREC